MADSSRYENVLKAQNDGLAGALGISRRCYGRVQLSESWSRRAIRLFVASTALVLREARRQPERFNEECAQAGIKRGKKRIEVAAIRLAAGDPEFRRPRWASAAAYIAGHPELAPTLRAAERLIRKTENGITGLAGLYTAQTSLKRRKPPKQKPVDLTNWADAQLHGVEPVAVLGPVDALKIDPPGFRLALLRPTADGLSNMWLLENVASHDIRSAVKKIKAETTHEQGRRRYVTQGADGVAHHQRSIEFPQESGDQYQQVTEGQQKSPEPGANALMQPSEVAGHHEPAQRQTSTTNHQAGPGHRDLECALPPGCQHQEVCGRDQRCLWSSERSRRNSPGIARE